MRRMASPDSGIYTPLECLSSSIVGGRIAPGKGDAWRRCGTGSKTGTCKRRERADRLASHNPHDPQNAERLPAGKRHPYLRVFASGSICMPDCSTLIVGAGPTGMTAAIELKRAGLDVRIIDKSDHMTEHSQALVVQARTLEQFQRYGIASEAVARGRKLRGARFFSEGKQIVSVSTDQIASRYPFLLFLPQSATEALLNEHMERLGVETERQVELESVAQDSRGVYVTLRHPDG